jgi:hypothetical protein
MPICVECGSLAAYWTIIDKKNNLREYCDDCFKKDDLAKQKKEKDDYRKKTRSGEPGH